MAAWLPLAAATALIVACGGGGGGGGTEAASPPASSPTGNTGGLLAFTPRNAGYVAGYPLWAAEALMRLGHEMAKELAAAAEQRQPTESGSCGFSGTWQRTLSDNDNSHSLSAGDVVTVIYEDCPREPLAQYAHGTVSLSLTAVQANGNFEALMSTQAPGMRVSTAVTGRGEPQYHLLGQARLQTVQTDTVTSMVMGAGGSSDDMQIVFPGDPNPADRVTAFRLEKSQHWDQARSALSLRMHYNSPALGGSFDTDMTAPLLSWLDNFPEPHSAQGQFHMRGRGGDLVTLSILGPGDTDRDLDLKLDQGGDGEIDATGGGRWDNIGLLSGYLFADYSPDGMGNSFIYMPDELKLRHPFRSLVGEPVGQALRLQFTRPLADTAAWRWRLMDLGLTHAPARQALELPVEAEFRGALVWVRPKQPLRYSHSYELWLDTGTQTAAGQVLRATTGGTLTLHMGWVGSFHTPNYLDAQIHTFSANRFLTPTQNMVLTAPEPPSGAPAVTYRWTQLSGTPVVLEQPHERQTTVRLAGSGSGIAEAVVQLSLSLADGTTELAQRAVRTVHDTTGAWSTALREPERGFTLPERLTLGSAAVGSLHLVPQTGQLQITYAEADPLNSGFSSWSATLRSGDGQPLQPGRYVNAWYSSAYDRPPGVPGLDFTLNGMDMTPWGAEFEIFEIEADTHGQITRLAVDLDLGGSAAYPHTKGSVRFNSTRPLAP